MVTKNLRAIELLLFNISYKGKRDQAMNVNNPRNKRLAFFIYIHVYTYIYMDNNRNS